MAAYTGQQASGEARQHNGNVYHYGGHTRDEERRAEQRKKDRKLYHAAATGQFPRLQALLRQGADVDFVNDDGYTVLQAAASHKAGKACVEVLISAGADIHQKHRHLGMTALHVACDLDNKDIVEVLLRLGADFNAADGEGGTALIAAVSPAIIEMLVWRGADVNHKDVYGITALHIAASYGHEEATQSLLHAGAETNVYNNDHDTPLLLAARHGHTAVIFNLIRAGAYLNDLDLKGRTPLHRAVRTGHVDVVRSLLAAGADPNARSTATRETPSDVLLESGRDLSGRQREILRLLEKHGARFRWPNAQKDT